MVTLNNYLFPYAHVTNAERKALTPAILPVRPKISFLRCPEKEPLENLLPLLFCKREEQIDYL